MHVLLLVFYEFIVNIFLEKKKMIGQFSTSMYAINPKGRS